MIISYTDIDEQNMAKGKIGMEITQHKFVLNLTFILTRLYIYI
jgi:hypothetical protein